MNEDEHEYEHRLLTLNADPVLFFFRKPQQVYLFDNWVNSFNKKSKVTFLIFFIKMLLWI